MHPELQSLLRQRLDVIADHTFRDSDSTAHLEALRNTSEKITVYAKTHESEFDAKLRHYLTNCSYQKALDHLST